MTGTADRVASVVARVNATRLPRPRCGGINPESDGPGYYCRACGYSLLPTRTGWWRHGDEWRHPEVWTGR